jgi:hypothetical protein
MEANDGSTGSIPTTTSRTAESLERRPAEPLRGLNDLVRKAYRLPRPTTRRPSVEEGMEGGRARRVGRPPSLSESPPKWSPLISSAASIVVPTALASTSDAHSPGGGGLRAVRGGARGPHVQARTVSAEAPPQPGREGAEGGRV